MGEGEPRDGAQGAGKGGASAIEARLKKAQSVAHVGSWELDLVRRVMWASEEAFRIYGLPLRPDGALPFEQVRDIPRPEHRPLLDRALRDLCAGHPYEIEFEILRPSDGQLRFVRSLAELSRDAEGRPSVVIGTIEDVTAEKLAARALRASEERARMLFEHAVDAILIGNPRGEIVAANEAALALTGRPISELVDLPIEQLFVPSSLERSPFRFDLLERGDTVVRVRELLRKSGAVIPVEMRTKKLPDGTYQTIMRDLTERRRMEEQLKLRQRMDSLGTLAGGIAHDFNNVLAAILGHADELGLYPLAPEQRRAVEGIVGTVRRAADLVRGLSSLTRPERAASTVFDVHKVAVEVFDVLEKTTTPLVAKRIRVPDGRFHVEGSESDVFHALMNLGINAVQAIEQKGASAGDEVTLMASDYLAGVDDPYGLVPGRYVHLAVSDTGVGMTAEVARRAFDPLFSTKAKGSRGGQGLGLTMVYKVVVDQHHGHVDIESTPGSGTTFHVLLPRAAGGPRISAAPVSRPNAPRGTETILVVDDEPSVLSLMQRALSRAGYTVLTAADGDAAIEVFERHAEIVAAVILDRSLPRRSGAEVMLRMMERRPSLKVIVSSGDSFPFEDEFPGAARLLSKPYTPAVLAAVLREVLETR